MRNSDGGGIILKSEKKKEQSSQVSRGKRVFKKATTLSANEIGITLRVDEDASKTLDEIQEESVKAARNIKNSLGASLEGA